MKQGELVFYTPEKEKQPIYEVLYDRYLSLSGFLEKTI